MKVLGVLLCMWALSGPCLFSPLEARPGSTFASNISGLSSSSSSSLFSKEEEEEPISLVSSDMEAQSPGMPVLPEVEVIHHQDLNKGILIALIAASSVLGVILLFVSCFMVYRLKSSKKHGAKSKQDTGDNFPNAVKGNSLPILDRFSSLKTAGKKRSVAVMDFQLLEAATNNFRENNALGEGGHGKVYKACFSDKRLAAVKRLEGGDEDIRSEFENEVNWLTKIQHHNIISLLGYCIHGETRYLVYEMMHNGSLESQLHGPMHGSGLSWHLRIKIAVDVARGLEYLHEHCNPTIVHRDLKASNILLDSNFNAKLSDFGLAVTSGIHNKNIKLSGTLGYVAPEYLLDGKLTDKSDVYAYGVVLLELLTGRKPIQKLPGEQYQSIVTWAMPHLTDRSKLSGIVDPVIKDTMDLKHLYQVAAVAVLCVQKEPSYRPLITDVLHSLIPLVPLELGGSLRTTEPVPSAPPSR